MSDVVLGRGKRNIPKVNYALAHSGKANVNMPPKKGKKVKKGPNGDKNDIVSEEEDALEEEILTEPQEEDASTSQNSQENTGENSQESDRENNSELEVSKGDNMSEKENSQETSEIDSDTLAAEAKKIEEVEKQLEEKRKRQSKKDKKAKLAALRQEYERKRKLLEKYDSEEEENKSEKRPKKKTKYPKSGNGKGVKNKGKKKEENKNSKRKVSDSSSEELQECLEDQVKTTIERVRRKSLASKKKKGDTEMHSLTNKNITFTENKRSKRSVTSGEDTSDSESDSSSSSSSTDSSSSDDERERRRSKKGKKKSTKKGKKNLKSGVKAKAHKIRIKKQQWCPQALLDDEYCTESLQLENLSFELLVAGELEICTLPEISRKERNTRMQILKLLTYFRNTLPQNIIIEVYKAVILKVEKGLFTWSSQLAGKVEKILDRAVSRNKTKGIEKTRAKEEGQNNNRNNLKEQNKREPGLHTTQGDKIIYCLEFNKNKCSKEQSHEGKFAGKDVWKHHICRVCLITDKEKRAHPEGDEACPHRSR